MGLKAWTFGAPDVSYTSCPSPEVYMGDINDTVKRQTKALERIADDLSAIKTFFYSMAREGGYEDGRKGDPEATQGERGTDHRNAVLEPNDTRRCASPADRYGWEGHPKTGSAVCSICCAHNLICKIKHRSFDDIGAPLSARKKPDPGQGQEGPEAKDLVE